MNSIDPAAGLQAAHEQLVAIWADPRIKALARRHAGDPEVASDALQSTYYAMARLKHLDQIENLRAYFCKVLIREVYRERGQLGAVLVDDFVHMAEERQVGADGHHASPSFDHAVCTSLQGRAWLNRLMDKRDGLLTAVPGRSDDPGQYRAVIYATARQVLRDGINGEPSEAGSNDAFRAAYPEYFDQPDASPDACHQRFRRARMDVRALLQAVVSQDELF